MMSWTLLSLLDTAIPGQGAALTPAENGSPPGTAQGTASSQGTASTLWQALGTAYVFGVSASTPCGGHRNIMREQGFLWDAWREAAIKRGGDQQNPTAGWLPTLAEP